MSDRYLCGNISPRVSLASVVVSMERYSWLKINLWDTSIIVRICWKYRNHPVFGQTSLGKHQTAPLGAILIRVFTVCHSVCIFWTLYSMVQPHCSNFRIITFSSVRILRSLTVNHYPNVVYATNISKMNFSECLKEFCDDKHATTVKIFENVHVRFLRMSFF